MRILLFTFGLLLGLCVSTVASAKVQLYSPSILEPSPDGYVKIEFEGLTTPNTEIEINPDNSLIIQSIYEFKKTEVPSSLKSFSIEFRKNIRGKQEGVFRLKAGCNLRSAASGKAKLIKKLKKESLQFAQSENKRWMKLKYLNKIVYASHSCLNRPRIRGLLLSPSVKSDAKGQFKLTATLPEGSIQLLFTVKTKKSSNHLFTLSVRSDAITSNTRFTKRPVVKKPKPVVEKKEEPESTPLTWGLRAELGLGFNYHSVSQEVGQATSIEFTNDTLPSLGVELAGNFNHFEVELAYADASNELSEAKAPYTLITKDYSLTSMALTGRYYLEALPQESSTGYALGYNLKTIPLFLVDIANNVDAGEMDLSFVSLGFVTRKKLTDQLSFPWELNLLIPVSSDSSVGSNSEIDAKLSASFKFAAQKLWFDDVYFASELSLDYFLADYAYISGVTLYDGEVSLLSTQIDFKLGTSF